MNTNYTSKSNLTKNNKLGTIKKEPVIIDTTPIVEKKKEYIIIPTPIDATPILVDYAPGGGGGNTGGGGYNNGGSFDLNVEYNNSKVFGNANDQKRQR